MSTADGRVPPERPQTSAAGAYKSGSPVRASDWLTMGSLAHWIAGCGQVVVPAHSVRIGLKGTVALRYRVPQNGRSIARVAVLSIRADVLGESREVDVTMGTSTARLTVGALVSGGRSQIYVLDTSVVRGSAASEIIVTVIGQEVVIDSCAIYELPRAALSRDATDGGVALDTLFPRRPIVDSATSSVRGVVALMQAIDGRRIGHLARYGPPIVISSASWTSLMRRPSPCVPRYDVSTKRDLTLDMYARAASATVYEYRFVSAAIGASAVGTISTTSLAWRGAVAGAVVCEDPNKPDGLPAAGADTVDVQVRRISGVGSVSVEGWCVYEAT